MKTKPAKPASVVAILRNAAKRIEQGFGASSGKVNGVSFEYTDVRGQIMVAATYWIGPRLTQQQNCMTLFTTTVATLELETGPIMAWSQGLAPSEAIATLRAVADLVESGALKPVVVQSKYRNNQPRVYYGKVA